MTNLRLLRCFTGLLAISTFVAVAAPRAAVKTEVVFIDRAVPDAETLVAALRPEVDVQWIERGEQGWSDMGEYFHAHRGLRAVHVVSHGSPGGVQLAGEHFDRGAFAAHSAGLDAWRAALAPDAHIALYGCDVARGDIGRAFVADLAARLGAAISASDNPTGSAARGGDWRLEVSTGSGSAASAFVTGAPRLYRDLLALPNGSQPIVTGSTSNYTADSALPSATYSDSNFTISGTTNSVASKLVVYTTAPTGATFDTVSYSNSTTPTFTLTVTAKAAVLASFKLSSITLKAFASTDSFVNVQVSATVAGGGTITNAAQSFSGNSADYVPDLTTGTFSTSTDITSFTITFKLGTTAATNTDMTLNAFSVTGAKPPAPTASTTAASSVATTSATLGGTATADAGGAAITARGIVYSSSNTTPTVGGTGVTNVSIGTGTGTFSQSVTGLPAGTLIYYRAYATNSGGTGYGSVLTFTTTTDSDGTVTAGTGVTEPVPLPTTATTSGAAVSLYDFKITDGGATDGVPLNVSQVVVSTSGTGPFSKVTWLLNGPDVSNVAGTYSSGSNTITFSGLGISVANATNETYTVKGYYNDNTGLTENQTFILSVTGGTASFTVGAGTQMAGSQSAVTNGTGSKVSVTATKLLFATQPSGSTSGSALTGQPVVKATDAAGNTDVDFVANVTLAVGSGGGSLSGTLTKTGVSGVATFTDVAYVATADQQAFTLTTSNGSSLTNATSNSVTSDVVATALQFFTQPVPVSIPSGTATAFSTVPVVRAVDAGGIVDTAARNITLTVTNTSGGAAAGTVGALGGVSGDTDASATIVTIPASSGVATFTGLSVTYTNDASSTNAIALRAASSGLTAATSSTITSTVKPAITSTLTASGTYGAAISTYTITGSNTPTSYSATGLPSGLSVNTTNGQITGTPTTNGSFNVTIGATNTGGTGTATLVFTVAKTALSITGVVVNNKTYDGTTASTLNVASAALSGVVNSDVLTLGTGSATGTFASKDVGTGKSVTISGFSVSGTNSGNYTLSQPTGLTADITAKALTVSGLTASAKIYDGLTTASLSGTAALQTAQSAGAGTTSDGKPYTVDSVSLTGTAAGSFADRHVGTAKTVTVTGLSLTGTGNTNYSLTPPAPTANITAKALTVSGLTATAKTYDGLTTASLNGTAALQATEAAGAGTTSDGKPYSVDSVSLSGTAAGTFADKNVGTAKAVTVTGLSLTGTGNTNYTVTQPSGLTANITAATLTVTADAKSRAYGLANPTFTATITGYVNGETSAVLSGSPSLTASATAASVPGAYAITAAVGTLSATNYTFGFVNGTLTISAQVINDWREENFTPSELLDANISGPSADPDSDGVTNLYEYAFGTDPNDPLSGPGGLQYSGTLAGGGTLVETGQPVSRVETSGSGTITRLLFVQRDASLTSDLSYTPQFSSNGTTWVNGTGTSSVLAADGLYEVVSAPYSLFVGGKKTRYYRVLVEIVP